MYKIKIHFTDGSRIDCDFDETTKDDVIKCLKNNNSFMVKIDDAITFINFKNVTFVSVFEVSE